MEDRRCSGCTLSSLTLTSSPPLSALRSWSGVVGGGVLGVRWWDFTVSRPCARRTSSGLRGCMWFDFCCSNELHGYRPDTNGCGLFKLSSLKSHANASGALNMWWAFFFCVSGELFFSFSFFFFLHLFVGQRLRVTRRITRLTPFWRCWCRWGWKSPCKSCYLAPVQGIGASAISIFSIYGHMLYFLRRRPNAPLLCCNRRLIFRVSELWIVVLPHCNKQMAARSWVITNPLREWLVLSRAALIRARWLSPVFAQALKSSSGFVTLGVCSG